MWIKVADWRLLQLLHFDSTHRFMNTTDTIIPADARDCKALVMHLCLVNMSSPYRY